MSWLLRLLGVLNFGLAGLNYALFIFHDHSVVSLLAALFCTFVGVMNWLPDNKPKQLPSYDAIISDLDRQAAAAKRKPFHTNSTEYADLRIKECKYQMLRWRAQYYHKTKSQRIREFIFRFGFPDKEDYAETRAFWLDHIATWRQIRRSIVSHNERMAAREHEKNKILATLPIYQTSGKGSTADKLNC